MKEFWIYTGLRIALFVASLGVVAGLWMLASDEVPLLWVVVVAFLLSAVVPFWVLPTLALVAGLGLLLVPARRHLGHSLLIAVGVGVLAAALSIAGSSRFAGAW